MLHYLLPLSFRRVNVTTYRALQRLVLAMSLVTSFELGNDEIAEIEKHLTLFVEWFYDTYYQRNYDRLPACKYTVHSLLVGGRGLHVLARRPVAAVMSRCSIEVDCTTALEWGAERSRGRIRNWDRYE